MSGAFGCPVTRRPGPEPGLGAAIAIGAAQGGCHQRLHRAAASPCASAMARMAAATA